MNRLEKRQRTRKRKHRGKKHPGLEGYFNFVMVRLYYRENTSTQPFAFAFELLSIISENPFGKNNNRIINMQEYDETLPDWGTESENENKNGQKCSSSEVL